MDNRTIETKNAKGINWSKISLVLVLVSIAIQLLWLCLGWLVENKDFGNDPSLFLLIIPLLFFVVAYFMTSYFGLFLASISIVTSILGIVVNVHPQYANHKFRDRRNMIIACVCLLVAVGGLLRFIFGPNTETISAIKDSFNNMGN